jgi:hypothetical protein
MDFKSQGSESPEPYNNNKDKNRDEGKNGHNRNGNKINSFK